MDNNAKRDIKPMSLHEALAVVDESLKEKKASYTKFMDIYTQYQRQAKRPPEDLRDLLEKGITIYSDDQFKILIKAYTLIKQHSTSIPFIQTYILSKCINKLDSLDYKITAESLENDVAELLHKEETEAESIRVFIRDVIKKNSELEANKLGKSDILSLLYLFFAISIEATIREGAKQARMLIEMERVFVEETISLPGKDLHSLTCRIIPENLAKGKIDKSFSSMCYLYYDFKLKSQEFIYLIRAFTYWTTHIHFIGRRKYSYQIIEAPKVKSRCSWYR